MTYKFYDGANLIATQDNTDGFNLTDESIRYVEKETKNGAIEFRFLKVKDHFMVFFSASKKDFENAKNGKNNSEWRSFMKNKKDNQLEDKKKISA